MVVTASMFELTVVHIELEYSLAPLPDLLETLHAMSKYYSCMTHTSSCHCVCSQSYAEGSISATIQQPSIGSIINQGLCLNFACVLLEQV